MSKWERSRTHIREWYDYEAKEYYQDRFSWKVNQYRDQVVKAKLLGYLVPSKILELGVGTGRHATYLPKYGFKVVGIDLSRGMLQQCRKKIQQGSASIDLCQMDAHQLHFSRATFDSVYCDRTFKFFTHPMKVLKEVYRVLKPNGRLILILVPIDVAEYYNTGYSLRFIKIRNKLYGSNAETISWIERSGLKGTAYSERKLREMLVDASFEVLTMEKLFNFPALLMRILPHNQLKLLLLLDKNFGKGSLSAKKLLVVAKK